MSLPVMYAVNLKYMTERSIKNQSDEIIRRVYMDVMDAVNRGESYHVFALQEETDKVVKHEINSRVIRELKRLFPDSTIKPLKKEWYKDYEFTYTICWD